MAVRHGYGKVAGADALRFAYDTGDTRNSYRGEPTENLITDTSTFGNTFWNQKSGTFTANDAIGPRGIQNAAKIVATNTDPYIYSSAIVTVSTGNVTWSIWVKGIGNTVGKSAQVRINFSGTATGTADTNASVNLTDRWQLLQTTANVTSGGTIKFGLEAPNGAVSGDVMYFADPMFEQKAHATQFTAGTRSATQGLLDLTGNRSIDLSNVSFDSNAQMTFDGTDDEFSIGTDLGFQNASFSLEAVINWDGGSTDTFFGYRVPTDGTQQSIHWRIYDYGQLRFDFYSNSINSASGAIVANTWYHLLVTYDYSTDTCICYRNGSVLMQGSAGPYLGADSTSTGYVGSWGPNNQHFGGGIPVFKVFNRALTAAEVKNNYNNYKKRFGI